MTKLLAIFILIALIASAILLTRSQKNQLAQTTPIQTAPEKPLASPSNFTASFAVFTNGTFRIFSSPMYHNLSENAYIDSPNPNIIQIKNPSSTWGDFFNSLPMQLTSSCLTTGTKQTFCTNDAYSLSFYINGQLASNALSQKINPEDQLLVSYGKQDKVEISTQLQQLKSITQQLDN